MKRQVFSLIFIVWARFFGLFVILPVLSAYASGEAWQIGLAVGAYALSQIIFAAPFGHLSDKIGRKKALALGIAIYGLGSVLCAIFSDSIYLLILGRLIQGAGAVGAVASAFIADIVPENSRSKYMALLGMGVGMAFVIAMISSPIIASYLGLSALFWLCALLCAISAVILLGLAEPEKHEHNESTTTYELIKNKNVRILSLSNFFQKMFLNAFFVSIGLVLVGQMGFERASLWQIYALCAVFGFFSMGVAGFLGDAKGKAKELFFASVIIFALSLLVFLISPSFENILFAFVGAVLFFIAFSLGEPILQSQMSKLTKAKRGAALGVLNACGYGGSFVGSLLGASYFAPYVMLALCVLWVLMLAKLDRI